MKLTDEEFEIVREKLYQLGLEDGDIGFEFWNMVSKYFEELRKNNIDVKG